MIRDGQILQGGNTVYLPKATLDTGANTASYTGRALLEKLHTYTIKPTKHKTRLGDGSTWITINEMVTLTISLYDDNNKLCAPITSTYYIVDKLGMEIIIGLPDIVRKHFQYFMNILLALRQSDDPEPMLSFMAPDNMVEKFNVPQVGELMQPWSSSERQHCPEEEETPYPLPFGEDILKFMETSVDESRKEYLSMVESHISVPMLGKCPQLCDLLCSIDAQEIFAPSEWIGLDIDPISFKLVGELPERLCTKARPVRPELFETAKAEFNRLMLYFYEFSDSPVASPLVIAYKATHPFIRFCGDYRVINKYISIPQQPIPIVQYELVKASKFMVYADLDMANSFHQLPLSDEFSNLLSVQTPWGLVRPKFLPEGVGPASGILQHIVREIFKDFEEWTIVIFDNFLVLANDYDDLYQKCQKILRRCREKRIVLKMKKSWFGVTTVNFFGYQVQHGSWRLSDERKGAIKALIFPKTLKQMQSFLGASLFFHQFVPNYTEWAAKLYEMTHDNFSWDKRTWTFDYEEHYNLFLDALMRASELYFPDYSLPWIMRCDASEYGVGVVLFQVKAIDDDITIQHQPIVFASKRFSTAATNWDPYKREAYALFFGVSTCAYYLRGKAFTLETDHRNLQWIESSEAPIVIRWRVLMQSYDFVIRHIAGKLNTVADYQSRLPEPDPPPSLEVATPTCSVMACDDHFEDCENTMYLTFEEIMSTVHGGRKFHLGAAETWFRAKQLFPDAHISLDSVRKFVKEECPMCQKTRDTGVKGLPEQYLTLKPTHYRRAVGIDHLTITPADHNGNTCVILIVEHFAHFPQAYPAKDYTADTVVIALFKHYCTFGVFDQLVSDPGSALLAEAVTKLNELLGVARKVSLIGRHESNGCESSGSQYLRHLRTLVFDERVVNRWSDDTILPLINFFLSSFPTSETGGLTPFQLKYGTLDAEYFRLPETLDAGEAAGSLLRALDENLQLIRGLSFQFQQDIVQKRSATTLPVMQYVPGDLVLWNPREHPKDFLPTKLTPKYFGPCEVVVQRKNDVECTHIVLGSEHVFHVSRLKPFLGTREEAAKIAKLDKDQFTIISVNYFRGNVFVRKSLKFNVSFEDNEHCWLNFTNDLSDTVQFKTYVERDNSLYPLRFESTKAKKMVTNIRKQVIEDMVNSGYLYLRYFDGDKTSFYDSLFLPDPTKKYVIPIRFIKYRTNSNRQVVVESVISGKQFYLDNYDVHAYFIQDGADISDLVIVDESFRNDFRKLFDVI